MKCHNCGKPMKYVREMPFNAYAIDGWRCACGQVYYQPEQAQRVLLLEKLKKAAVKAKLGKVRSNLILRLPQEVAIAFGLRKGEHVLIKVEQDGLKLVPA